MTALSRRRALTGSAVIGVGIPLIAGCGGPDSAGQAAHDGASGQFLADVADVPEAGCFVIASAKVVVTQPSAGEFKAFTAVCTHQQCLVSSATEGVIPCRCHGSRFSLADGSVVTGPAATPLTEVQIIVDGDTITVA